MTLHSIAKQYLEDLQILLKPEHDKIGELKAKIIKAQYFEEAATIRNIEKMLKQLDEMITEALQEKDK